MEAQRLLSGFCSPSPIPNARTQYFVRFPSPSPSPSSSSSSAASFAQSHRWVSFKARPLSTKLIQCRNTADTERAEVVVSSDKQDLTSGIRRKKLAVFVSGGGSNFRSIHEACLNGLILGDVVVLVASKQGVLNKRREKLEVVRTSMSQFVQQLEAGASVRIGTEEEAMAVGRLREFVSTSSLCALVLEDADDGVSGMVAEVAREAGFTRVNLDLSPAPHCPLLFFLHSAA